MTSMNKIHAFLGLFIAVVTHMVDATDDVTCVHFAGGQRCHVLVTMETTVTWSQAAEACRAQNYSHLSSIPDVETQTEVEKYLMTRKLNYTDTVWLGGQRSEGTWHWIDGKQLDVTKALYRVKYYLSTDGNRKCASVQMSAMALDVTSYPCEQTPRQGAPRQIVCQYKDVSLEDCQAKDEVNNKTLYLHGNRTCLVHHVRTVKSSSSIWRRAREFCIQNGGDLLTSLDDVTTGIIMRYMTSLRNSTWWLGLQRGLWVWRRQGGGSDTALNYTHWAEPIVTQGDHCAAMVTDTGTWVAKSCHNSTRHILCEREYLDPVGMEKDGLWTPTVVAGVAASGAVLVVAAVIGIALAIRRCCHQPHHVSKETATSHPQQLPDVITNVTYDVTSKRDDAIPTFDDVTKKRDDVTVPDSPALAEIAEMTFPIKEGVKVHGKTKRAHAVLFSTDESPQLPKRNHEVRHDDVIGHHGHVYALPDKRSRGKKAKLHKSVGLDDTDSVYSSIEDITSPGELHSAKPDTESVYSSIEDITSPGEANSAKPDTESVYSSIEDIITSPGKSNSSKPDTESVYSSIEDITSPGESHSAKPDTEIVYSSIEDIASSSQKVKGVKDVVQHTNTRQSAPPGDYSRSDPQTAVYALPQKLQRPLSMQTSIQSADVEIISNNEYQL